MFSIIWQYLAGATLNQMHVLEERALLISGLHHKTLSHPTLEKPFGTLRKPMSVLLTPVKLTSPRSQGNQRLNFQITTRLYSKPQKVGKRIKDK